MLKFLAVKLKRTVTGSNNKYVHWNKAIEEKMHFLQCVNMEKQLRIKEDKI